MSDYNTIKDIEQEKNIEANIKFGIQDYIKLKQCKIHEIYMNRDVLK